MLSIVFLLTLISFISSTPSCNINLVLDLVQTPSDPGSNAEIRYHVFLNDAELKSENTQDFPISEGDNCDPHKYKYRLYETNQTNIPCKGSKLTSSGWEYDTANADDKLWDIELVVDCDGSWKLFKECNNGGGARLAYRCFEDYTYEVII